MKPNGNYLIFIPSKVLATPSARKQMSLKTKEEMDGLDLGAGTDQWDSNRVPDDAYFIPIL